MVYGFTYFIPRVSCRPVRNSYSCGAGTRHAGADCIQHRKAWGAFSQMLFTSVKLQGGYGVGHAHGTRSHGADSFLVSRGVLVILYGLCVFVCGARGDNVCV